MPLQLKQLPTWPRCLVVQDLRVFRATEGPRNIPNPLVFGVETAVWTVSAKNVGKWYQLLEVAERFKVKLPRDEADACRKRNASAVGGNSRKETPVDTIRMEAAARVGRYQTN